MRIRLGWRNVAKLSVVALAGMGWAAEARADEGGLSFWLPGLQGSFAAVPTTPGLSFAAVYVHPSASSDSEIQFPRGGKIDLGINGRGDLLAFGPTYTFSEPLWGGQASISLLAIAGRNTGSVTGSLSGPLGSVVSGARSDSITGLGDLFPQFTLKWNDQKNNYMTYVTGNIPIGAYDPDRLANLGLGHAAADWGVGYTYFDPDKGHEFSIVGGLTYNFENTDTDYQSGIDSHLDLAASQFLNDQVFVGAVGYVYQQLTGDSGSGAVLGDFKSRVYGIGPQVGFNFKASEGVDGLLNLKGYYEFGSQNRPEGWNIWLTVAFSPSTKNAP